MAVRPSTYIAFLWMLSVSLAPALSRPVRAAPAPPGASPSPAPRRAVLADGAMLQSADLPTGRELAEQLSAALDRVQTARLTARLWNGHHTEIHYVAPDRAFLREWNARDQELATYLIIGDVAYYEEPRAFLFDSCQRFVDERYRRQAQIFRAIQVALATGVPQPSADGAEVEQVVEDGQPALRATLEYFSSAELEEVGLRRNGSSTLEVVVDPVTWLPYRTREETQDGVTEVEFLAFDEPLSVDPPAAC